MRLTRAHVARKKQPLLQHPCRRLLDNTVKNPRDFNQLMAIPFLIFLFHNPYIQKKHILIYYK